MPGLVFEKAHHTSNMQHNDRQRGKVFFSVCCKSFLNSDLRQLMSGRIGSPAAACSVAGGFCYGRLLDESCIARESQNSPSPARAYDRLLSIGGLRIAEVGQAPPGGGDTMACVALHWPPGWQPQRQRPEVAQALTSDRHSPVVAAGCRCFACIQNGQMSGASATVIAITRRFSGPPKRT
jgi:hypothetical protein